MTKIDCLIIEKHKKKDAVCGLISFKYHFYRYLSDTFCSINLVLNIKK